MEEKLENVFILDFTCAGKLFAAIGSGAACVTIVCIFISNTITIAQVIIAIHQVTAISEIYKKYLLV